MSPNQENAFEVSPKNEGSFILHIHLIFRKPFSIDVEENIYYSAAGILQLIVRENI
mgnify:FL=1